MNRAVRPASAELDHGSVEPTLRFEAGPEPARHSPSFLHDPLGIRRHENPVEDLWTTVGHHQSCRETIAVQEMVERFGWRPDLRMEHGVEAARCHVESITAPRGQE